MVLEDYDSYRLERIEYCVKNDKELWEASSETQAHRTELLATSIYYDIF